MSGEPKYRRTEEPKFVEERVIRFRGFKSAEEAREFLREAQAELDRMSTTLRRVLTGLERFIEWVSYPTIEAEIEYHKRRIRELESMKRRLELEGEEET